MKRLLLCLLAAICLLASSAQAAVRLPALMSDNMVLQQNNSVHLWGWSDAKKVTITTSWDKQRYSCECDAQGAWSVHIKTGAGSYTPQQINISDGKSSTTIKGVLIGEVWVCSGQSNMDMHYRRNVAETIDGSFETLILAGQYRDKIHFFTVPRTNDHSKPRTDVEGASWEAASPETTIDCSAVAYHFAKTLTSSINVPVGLLISSWGASTIETWMDENTLRKVEGADIEKARANTFQPNQRLGYLFNSMLTPIVPYTAKGFLWYQGESNLHNPALYPQMQVAMVELWRDLWGDPDMPFYSVQIAPYRYSGDQNIEAALVREAQAKAAEITPNSGIISTIDIGDRGWIHPARKEEVGQRLAAMALSKTYGNPAIPAAAPMMSKVEFENGRAIVSFDNAEYGLTPRGKAVNGFEIAGADRRFFPATAVVRDRSNKVDVWSPEVRQPVAVRYAFSNYVDELTLCNVYHQGAFPFRTDDWDDVSCSRISPEDNPLAVIKETPGLSSIFHSWGFIGDSLCSGEHEHNGSGRKGYIDLYEYSWGDRICQATGARGDVYAQGGETTKGWIEHYWDTRNNGHGGINAKDDPKQAYIIALGINDARLPQGDISTDIVKDDYTQNAQTFVGCYAGIIQRLQSIQPDAKIFVVTRPRDNNCNLAYNEIIRSMAKLFNNVYVIDLYKYAPSYKNGTPFRDLCFLGGHMNAAGYQYTAWMMMTYIDWIIRHNPKDFQQVAFIGTDYSYISK